MDYKDKATYKEVTMVEHKVIKNKEGYIVACLYILPNGNLHSDSWFCLEGWGSPSHWAYEPR